VFIVTDFSAGDEESNDEDGYRRFRAVLTGRRLRAYWLSVRDPPPPIYTEIAGASGGSIVRMVD
jgi:hypothetical protein